MINIILDYCDSIQILKDMRKNQSVWRSKRIINRAKKLQEQGEKAKHFCRRVLMMIQVQDYLI